MLHKVGRLAGVPCLHKVLYHCLWVPTTQASGMSKQLEKTDFGPDGFKWLTLKRIVVRCHAKDLSTQSSVARPAVACIYITRALLLAVSRSQRQVCQQYAQSAGLTAVHHMI